MLTESTSHSEEMIIDNAPDKNIATFLSTVDPTTDNVVNPSLESLSVLPINIPGSLSGKRSCYANDDYSYNVQAPLAKKRGICVCFSFYKKVRYQKEDSQCCTVRTIEVQPRLE